MRNLLALALTCSLIACNVQPPPPADTTAADARAARKAQMDRIERESRERSRIPSAQPPGNAFWREQAPAPAPQEPENAKPN